MSIGDVNGDGRPDLNVANATSGTLSVLLNTMPAGSATPAFAAQQTFATGSTPRFVAIADYNADGCADLALANSGASTVSVLLNTFGASALGSIIDDDVTPTPAEYHARQDTAHANIELWPTAGYTGTPILIQPIACGRAIRVPGSGADDVLSLDFANGNPIPCGGLTFDGGGGSDEVVLGNVPAGSDLSISATQVLFGTSAITLSSVEDVQLAASADVLLGSLSISAGAALGIAAGGRTLHLTSLSLDPAACMDLADNTLIVDDASAYAALRDRIASARNSAGLWDGVGLGSSAARDDLDGIHGLGIAIASPEFQISNLTSGVVVKYTLNGDSDLNGVIDADDYYRMDVAYRLQSDGQHVGWANGDVDYQNGISADDFYLIDRAYIRQPSPPAAKSQQPWSLTKIDAVWG